MVFFRLSISMFSFVLQQLFSVCIFIGTQQSEIARGGEIAGSQGFQQLISCAFSLGFKPVPNSRFFPMGKSGLPPGFPSVEGVVFIFVGFYRDPLSRVRPSFLLFSRFSLSHCVPQGDVPRLEASFVIGAWEVRGVSSLSSLFSPLGNFWKCSFFFLRGLVWTFSPLPFNRSCRIPCQVQVFYSSDHLDLFICCFLPLGVTSNSFTGVFTPL